jgi:hypothetical protein
MPKHLTREQHLARLQVVADGAARGCSVRWVMARLGVSSQALRQWLKLHVGSLAWPPSAEMLAAARVRMAQPDYASGQTCRVAVARPSPRARLVLAVAAQHMDVPLADVLGAGRNRVLVRARQAAMWAMRQAWPEVSTTHLAQWLGYADHTTVVYHIRAADRLVAGGGQHDAAFAGVAADLLELAHGLRATPAAEPAPDIAGAADAAADDVVQMDDDAALVLAARAQAEAGWEERVRQAAERRRIEDEALRQLVARNAAAREEQARQAALLAQIREQITLGPGDGMDRTTARLLGLTRWCDQCDALVPHTRAQACARRFCSLRAEGVRPQAAAGDRAEGVRPQAAAGDRAEGVAA